MKLPLVWRTFLLRVLLRDVNIRDHGRTTPVAAAEAEPDMGNSQEEAELEQMVLKMLEKAPRPVSLQEFPVPSKKIEISGTRDNIAFIEKLLMGYDKRDEYHREVLHYVRGLRATLTPIMEVMRNAGKWRHRYQKARAACEEKDRELIALRTGKKPAASVTMIAPEKPVDSEEMTALRAENALLKARLERRDVKGLSSGVPANSTPVAEPFVKLDVAPKTGFWSQSDAGRLKREIETLKTALPPLEAIGAWAKLHLQGRVVLTERALDEVQRSEYRDPSLLFFSLLLLAHEYRDQCMAQDRMSRAKLKAVFNEKAKALGLEEGFSASDLILSQYSSEYTVRHGGRDFTLDRALKRGTSFAPSECFRCYFAYDRQTRQVIVGSLPRHLTNTLS